MSKINRRDFIKNSVLAGAGLGLAPAMWKEASAQQTKGMVKPALPAVVSSANGEHATARAMELLKGGSDPLDAVIPGVNLVEDDPNDISVGYGGLPNEDGVVQLDSSVMHGPLRRAGAVACLEGVRTPSLVAKCVMEQTDHHLLVGSGARHLPIRL